MEQKDHEGLNHTKTNGDRKGEQSVDQCYGKKGGGTDEEKLVFVGHGAICFIYITFKPHNNLGCQSPYRLGN